VRRAAAEDLPSPSAGRAVAQPDRAVAQPLDASPPASLLAPEGAAAPESVLWPDAAPLVDPHGSTLDAPLEPAYGGFPYPDDFGAEEWAPFDWVRHFGFRHSSTSGRHVGRGLPLERTSWLNRPLHVDWFAGPLITDSVDPGRVGQSNEVFAGLRLGWDFDYYWGIEWRFGWADPDLTTSDDVEFNGNYFVSDVGLVYYPWGDSRIRPYLLAGLGLAEIGSVRPDGSGQEDTLIGMPLGGGVQFAQTRYLTWRLEILDNIAWGDNDISTMHNFSFTLGMELRLGARPQSYWPWRPGRTVW
jgi:opacity protein-like surface antigen